MFYSAVRFRSYFIVLTADIEKAFLMVRISKQDRDSLPFLWLVDPSKPDSEEKVEQCL